MPVTPTYPGVYVEEVPSGVHTIIGVPTSVTAFLGRAYKGPVDKATVIDGWGDFERQFGGLKAKFPLSYAVQDFFGNGGGRAVIVRLYKKPSSGSAKATFTQGTLKLEAANEGTWGNSLQIRVDHEISQEVADDYGLNKTDFFNLLVWDKKTGNIESFYNLTVKEDGPRFVKDILKAESELVRVTSSDATLPTETKKLAAGDTADVIWSKDEYWTKADSGTGAAAVDSDALTSTEYKGSQDDPKKGLYALDDADIFNLLCIPPDKRDESTESGVYTEAMTYCEKRRAFLIVDPPMGWKKVSDVTGGLSGLTYNGTKARNAAFYFPRIRKADPLKNDMADTFPASGAIAGIYARTDTLRGVWKAPAGVDAAFNGVLSLVTTLTDAQNGNLNPIGVNCLRTFPLTGSVVWGARTLRGADTLADEYKYVPVRRTALFIEESLYRGLKWAVFEPNDEPLWAQIRMNVGAFMNDLFRQGAFQGSTPREAYLVKCDKDTTSQTDIDKGIVNIVVGFAPLKPAEFVIIKIRQLAGQEQV